MIKNGSLLHSSKVTYNSNRVAVAMSGGVDSSVAAALLRERGYEVIGIMLRLWSETGLGTDNRCCSPDAMAQARRVAAILDIPFYVMDAKEVFFDHVVKYFINGYAQGITPNPCLICNLQIRWNFLLNAALSMEANYLATGHYVRCQQNAEGQYVLLRAFDRSKDQSYVLHVLDQQKLSHALFPIGEYTKPQIRELARKYRLPVADRPESQDLCFLANGDYRSFLIRHAPHVQKPGPIFSPQGTLLGEHQGLAFYTIGQRRGLGIASSQPLYVIDKDIHSNALIVGPKNALGSRELIAGNVNWISEHSPTSTFRAQVKIRYKAQEVWATVTPMDDHRVYVLFDLPLKDITPGQAAVFYQDEICLGGGIIQP